MNKYKTKIIIALIIAAVLAAVFWWGGNAPGMRGWSIDAEPGATESEAQPTTGASNKQETGTEAQPATEAPNIQETESGAQSVAEAPIIKGTVPETSEIHEDISPDAIAESTSESDTPGTAEGISTHETFSKPEPEHIAEALTRPGGTEGGLTAQEKLDLAAKMAGELQKGVEPGNAEYSQAQGMTIDPETGKDRYLTDPVAEGRPVPVEPQNTVITNKAYTCTLSVCCDTILDNMSWLDPEKEDLVPEDGVIFSEKEVTFYEGESVFNVLLREMKKNRIHMEFVNTPMYNSAYIEGIANLYEFDCGELSGWMYKVNDWFPNYGCSRYQLKPGDRVEWVYTCDLGIDVGGYQAVEG